MDRRPVASSVLVFCAAFFAAPAAMTAPAAEPAPSPAPVTLKVVPGTNGAPWRMQIENIGEGPVRIPADPHLLVLELSPVTAEPDPGEKKKKKAPAAPPRCVLPDDARPSSDEGRELVIPPKRSWSASFDPLFYCFGARERAALVQGTSVKARFGWPRANAKPGKTAPPAPPFAVAPVGATVGKVAPTKEIEADPFVLGESVVTTPPSEAPQEPVTLSVPEALDAARGVELATTVTLTNMSGRPITLLYRPDVILFKVTTRAGIVSCGAPRQVTAPIRELLSTVPPKGKVDTTLLFTATCPAGTFDEPGIYRVLPRIDTTGASARALGISTWDGVATAKAPLLLRVRNPRKTTLPPRPTLD